MGRSCSTWRKSTNSTQMRRFESDTFLFRGSSVIVKQTHLVLKKPYPIKGILVFPKTNCWMKSFSLIILPKQILNDFTPSPNKADWTSDGGPSNQTPACDGRLGAQLLCTSKASVHLVPCLTNQITSDKTSSLLFRNYNGGRKKNQENSVEINIDSVSYFNS